jgi:C4-dicarboxylate-specific signal transduction histidine kinase
MMSSATGVQTVAAVPETQPLPAAVVLATIAHELRQPLSAIESIAYYLRLVLPRDSAPAREQAERLQRLVEQSNWILTCALQLADRTPLAPTLVNLEELVTRVVGEDSAVSLELAGGLPPVRLDPVRGRALLENLRLLFRQVTNDLHPVRIATAAAEGGVALSIASAVPGYRSEAGLGPGCGLSIESARRVVALHGGTFRIHVDAVSGVGVEVVLP